MPRLCYYCGSPATSKEHLPPRQFFKGFECDRITVYSCDLHNNQKSEIDTAILVAFIVSMREAKIAFNSIKYDKDINSALMSAQEQIIRSKKLVHGRSVEVDINFNHNRVPRLAYLYGKADIKTWIKQLTAGLVIHALGRYEYITDWESVFVWSFEYYEQDQMRLGEYIDYIQEANLYRGYFDHLPWIHGWSANPRPYPRSIYHFDVCFNVRPDEIIFRHTFYNSYKWYVRFVTSPIVQMAVTKKSNPLYKVE